MVVKVGASSEPFWGQDFGITENDCCIMLYILKLHIKMFVSTLNNESYVSPHSPTYGCT